MRRVAWLVVVALSACAGILTTGVRALDLGREPEVHPEIRLAFLALGVQYREGRQEAGTDPERSLSTERITRSHDATRGGGDAALAHVVIHGERVHVAGESEAPAVAHLHRELGFGGLRRA